MTVLETVDRIFAIMIIVNKNRKNENNLSLMIFIVRLYENFMQLGANDQNIT